MTGPAASPIPLDPAREEAELREYLGEGYRHECLQRYDETLEAELSEIGDEDRLYRESEAYLYNLTAFAMTGTKLPYLELLLTEAPPPARVLDYGCGIGSDGLALLELGYDVEFADFDNPSTRYLRWRLERRGLRADVHDLDAGEPGGAFDVAYAFDVIEHVRDPERFLDRLERQARLVLVNLLDPVKGETALHHDLPVRTLLRRCARRGLRRYSRMHGRSHVVLYEPARTGVLARLRAGAVLLRGRLTA